jgi:ribonuclease Z
MMPLPNRWLSAVLLRQRGRLVLLDCGEGTQITQKALGWGFKALDAICLSHYHADHVAGLPGMLLMLGNSGRTEPLTIFGPPGLQQVVSGLRSIAPQLPYEVQCVEPEPGRVYRVDGRTIDPQSRPARGQERGGLGSQAGRSPGVAGHGTSVATASGLLVSVLPVDHALHCLAYGIELTRTRAFLPERARAMGLPVQLWSRLQRGEPVDWDGHVVSPEEVLGPARRGVRVVFVTDTRPTPEMPEFISGADLLICEGTYGDPADLPKAVERKHLLFREAAELARAGNARQLWLTHFSPALEEPHGYAEQATSVFPRTTVGHDRMSTTLRFLED